MMEGFYTALEDAFPRILRKHRRISMAVICLMFFILSLPMVTHVIYIYTIFLRLNSRQELIG